MSLRIFSGFLVGAFAIYADLGVAQDYPTRPITAIVPFAPGGPVDTITRIVSEHMSRTRTDFEPLALLAGTPTLIYARKDFPPKDLGEFVVYVKANADKLNNAHAGVGSVAYTTCLLLNHLLGVKPTMIPYNGGAPALNALVAGQVDYMCDQIINGMAQVQSGQIKGYAIATPNRHPLLPNVPTTREAGLPEYQASAWNAMFAPKGTRKPIIDKLNAAIVKALDDATVRKRLLEIGSDIPDASGRTPEALAGLVKSEIDKWTPIMKEAAAAK